MYVRLAFATAVQVDADILLIDEVLAVGDAAFQQKCFDEFARLREEGRTILFVTHDMSAVERFCNRAMLLERGGVVEIGDPPTIARKYNHLNFNHVRAERGLGSPELAGRHGAEVAEVLNAWFEDEAGDTLLTAEQGKPLTVRVRVRFSVAVDDPIFSITLQNEAGNMVFSTNTDAQRVKTGGFTAGTTADIRIGFENRLGPGRYRLFATVAPRGLGADVFDAHITNSIMVLGERPGGGLVDFAHSFDIERS
jgi:ABC-type methionine transport system ATPase subunit